MKIEISKELREIEIAPLIKAAVAKDVLLMFESINRFDTDCNYKNNNEKRHMDIHKKLLFAQKKLSYLGDKYEKVLKIYTDDGYVCIGVFYVRRIFKLFDFKGEIFTVSRLEQEIAILKRNEYLLKLKMSIFENLVQRFDTMSDILDNLGVFL